MIDVAKKLDRTHFLAFTKKYELVNEYLQRGESLPDNLHIVLSAWGASLAPDNPYRLPVAYVRLNDSNDCLIPTSAVECSGSCSTCLQCWRISNGESVVFNKH